MGISTARGARIKTTPGLGGVVLAALASLAAACGVGGADVPDVMGNGITGSSAVPGASGGESSASGIPGVDPGSSDEGEEGTPSPSSGACAIDTHVVLRYEGRLVETVTARGQVYTFEADGTPWKTNGFDLTTVERYAAGPCAGKAAGSCVFDTRAYATIDGASFELVTAYGKSWSFQDGATAKAIDLSTVARYSDVCALRGGGACTFDTRAFVVLSGKLTELITAYGRHWSFDEDGRAAADNGGDLSAVARYADGPCRGAGAAAGAAPCRFDTRTFGVSGGELVELITAGGRIYRYAFTGARAFQTLQPNDVPLTSVPGWGAGPCAGS